MSAANEVRGSLAVGLFVAVVGVGAPRLARAETADVAACEARLPELERDWEQTKQSEVLLEIARCSEATGDDVRAVGALQRWLRDSVDGDGDGDGDAERRADVEKRSALLQSRTARVSVTSEVAGVELRIDGRCAVDATTFEPACSSDRRDRVLAANPGERRLTVKHPGFRDVAHVLTLAAGDDVHVSLTAARFHEQINPYRDPAWTAWAVTGGALVGATVLGVRTAFDPDGLNSAAGVATLAFGSVAVIAAGFATYFTVRASRWRPRRDVSTALDVLGPGYRF